MSLLTRFCIKIISRPFYLSSDRCCQCAASVIDDYYSWLLFSTVALETEEQGTFAAFLEFQQILHKRYLMSLMVEQIVLTKSHMNLGIRSHLMQIPGNMSHSLQLGCQCRSKRSHFISLLFPSDADHYLGFIPESKFHVTSELRGTLHFQFQ